MTVDGIKKVISAPLQVRRLSEIVETHIRDLILKGEIKAGQRLPTEKELCQQFGVSAVTAREALKGLEALGFIEKKKGKNGGIFVSEPTSEAVIIPLHNLLNAKKVTPVHITELRTILECAAVRIAARVITTEELAGIEENIRVCERKIGEIRDDIAEKDFFEIEMKNVEFHRLIGEATHNPMLSLTLDYVLDFLFMYKKKVLKPEIAFTKETIEDHKVILTQLRDGNVAGAEKEMLLHLENVEQYFLESAPANNDIKDQRFH